MSILDEIHEHIQEHKYAGICTFCGSQIGEFKDDLSRQEWAISGLCQECQDEIFREPGDDKD